MNVKMPMQMPTEVVPKPFENINNVTGKTVDGVTWYTDIQYAMIPGYRPLLLDLAVPEGEDPKPLIIHIHGGAWLTGSKNAQLPDFDEYLVLRANLLSEGFAVASVQYRLSAEAVFPAQLHDVKSAVRWLRNYSQDLGINPELFGATGESAGGYLSLFLGSNVISPELEGTVGVAEGSSRVSVCAAWYPPTRFDTIESESLPNSPFGSHDSPNSPESLLIGIPLPEDRERAYLSSPIAHLSELSAPTLLIHGQADQLVSYKQSVGYSESLQKLNIDHELVIVENADHCFFGAEIAPIVNQTVEFFKNNLMK